MDLVVFSKSWIDGNYEELSKEKALNITDKGSEAFKGAKESRDYVVQYFNSDEVNVCDAICVRAYLGEFQDDDSLVNEMKKYAFDEYGITGEQFEEWYDREK